MNPPLFIGFQKRHLAVIDTTCIPSGRQRQIAALPGVGYLYMALASLQAATQPE